MTPAGTPVARMVVECGDRPGELPLTVVITGDNARSLASTLKTGQAVTVRGALRALGGSLRSKDSAALLFEVVADEVSLG